VRYGRLPAVQPVLYGIAPATTAIITGAVVRLSGAVFKSSYIALLSAVVLILALLGFNYVILLFAAGIAGALYLNRNRFLTFIPFTLLYVDVPRVKYIFIFLKIGAILYGSGYVLFAYMHEALVEHHHWLTERQLTDAIAVGQVTPGPVLSSATFAGYLIDGSPGAVLATVAIFLPSFFIALFMSRLLNFVNRNVILRDFLNIVNGASVALIAAVAIQMVGNFTHDWRAIVILLVSLALAIFTRINSLWLILMGSAMGYLLLKM
jgi:chromate transporter